MGAYDGHEVCKLVRSFLLYGLSLEYNKTNIGLYRDDGLAVFRNVSGPHCEKIKKEFQKLFQLYLQTYHKPNDEICYILKEFNHPLSVTKQLPNSIEKRLPKLSLNEKVFNESVFIYQEALDKIGYSHKLTFQKTSTNNTQGR